MHAVYHDNVHLSFHYVCTIDSLMNELISVLITTLFDQVGLRYTSCNSRFPTRHAVVCRI